jgi:hypothetical protein
MGHKEIRHIDTLKQEAWFTRPWILLGTGPSLDRFNPKEWEGYNIAAVYDAYFACDFVDVLFVSDRWHNNPSIENWYWLNDNIRHVATRSVNVIHIGNDSNTVLWDYDCDVKEYHLRLFQNELYPCSNTSSFAVLWLGKMGVKRIHTFGIDGGKGVSKYVSEAYRKSIEDYHEGLNYDFTHENGGVYGHANSYGIELVKQ